MSVGLGPKPILKLQKASLDITKGNFDIDVDTKDEIQELSKSLKIMIMDILLQLSKLQGGTDISADRNYLYRVVYNFIDNAIKFSNEDGMIELISVEDEDEIRICVKDKGIGIEDNYIDDIWQRYYKNRKSGGVGIGLAIDSEILRLHDFKYGVISKIGNGTEIFFIVPSQYTNDGRNLI